MLNESESADPQQVEGDASDAQQTVLENLNRIANKAAKRAGSRQQRYDAEHGIFTK